MIVPYKLPQTAGNQWSVLKRLADASSKISKSETEFGRLPLGSYWHLQNTCIVDSQAL